MAECRTLLRETGPTLTLRLQENPLGFAAYQARAGIARRVKEMYCVIRRLLSLYFNARMCTTGYMSMYVCCKYHKPILQSACACVCNECMYVCMYVCYGCHEPCRLVHLYWQKNILLFCLHKSMRSI